MCPCSSMRKVVRCVPSYSFPMNFLSPHTPKASCRLKSSSQAKSKGILPYLVNELHVLGRGVRADAQYADAGASANASWCSVKLHACAVQPGVISCEDRSTMRVSSRRNRLNSERAAILDGGFERRGQRNWAARGEASLTA